MLRHAQVVAANEADYKANVELIPTFNAMLKKSPGLKAVYVAFDPAKNTFTNTSIWDNAQSVAAVTGSDEWKATVAKLKASALNIEVLEIQPDLSSHKLIPTAPKANAGWSRISRAFRGIDRCRRWSSRRLVVRRETGNQQEVQVHYDEDVASHIAPKPCVVTREGQGKASAGDRLVRAWREHCRRSRGTRLAAPGPTLERSTERQQNSYPMQSLAWAASRCVTAWGLPRSARKTMASNDRRYSAASAIAIIGRRLRVPTAISYACPAWNSVASMNGLAINCIDTGSPPAPNPVHTLIAG